jgi:hypothetical protein
MMAVQMKPVCDTAFLGFSLAQAVICFFVQNNPQMRFI